MAITVNHQTNDMSATSGSITIDGAAAGGGAYNLIGTTTVTSAVTNVDFTSIGNFNRYALMWDCITDAARVPLLRIFDNGTLITSSSYAVFRKNLDTNLAVQTTFSGWLGNSGVTNSIGRLEISTANSRAAMELSYGGFTGTDNTANYFIATGGMVSGFSLTDITGFSFTTTNEGAVILSGRFSLYGVTQ